MTCRSIPAAAWEDARKLLVFYFSRGHGLANAEDLAQETLAALWRRQDYEFEKEEDFPQVCYSFARLVSLAAYRQERKRATVKLDNDVEAPRREGMGLNSAELAVFVREVIQAGKDGLSEQEWLMIEMSLTADRAVIAASLALGSANNVGVLLHRARKKLAGILGWKSLL